MSFEEQQDNINIDIDMDNKDESLEEPDDEDNLSANFIQDEDVDDDDDDELPDELGDDPDEILGQDKDDEEDEDNDNIKNIFNDSIEDLGESDDDDDDNMDEDYLYKLDDEMREDIINNYHPLAKSHNFEEVKASCKIIRDKDGNIIDELHRTLPILTKYERTRILGQRAAQLENGASPLIDVPSNIIDSAIIAEMELKEKKIPFIIRRPLPNRGSEYWKLEDLEILN